MGNASGVNHEAAVVLIRRETAADLVVKPLARLLGIATAGVEPTIMVVVRVGYRAASGLLKRLIS